MIINPKQNEQKEYNKTSSSLVPHQIVHINYARYKAQSIDEKINYIQDIIQSINGSYDYEYLKQVDINSISERVDSLTEYLHNTLITWGYPQDISYNKTFSDIDRYSLGRILRAFDIGNPQQWITNNTTSKLKNNTCISLAKTIVFWADTDPDNRIRIYLETEFGYLLPELRTLSFKIKDVELSKVIIPGHRTYDKPLRSDPRGADRVTGLLISRSTWDNNSFHPQLLSSYYEVLDGYSRVKYAKYRGWEKKAKFVIAYLNKDKPLINK